MGPIWVLSAPDGPHVGPMNLAIRDIANIMAAHDLVTQGAKVSTTQDIDLAQLEYSDTVTGTGC